MLNRILPYIILLFSVIFALIFNHSTAVKKKDSAFKFICFCLIFFAGFRYRVGTDFDGYVETFHLIVTQGRYYELEWGYFWLVKLCAALGGNAQLVFLLFSAATMCFIYKFIDYFSEDKDMSWLIFLCIGPYFLSTFNGMRQWLSTAIFAFSLKYVNENNFKRYALSNSISALFHYSSLILIPFYPILKSKNLTISKMFICFLGFELLINWGVISYIAELLHASVYVDGAAALRLDWSYGFFFILSIMCVGLFYIEKNAATHINPIFRNLNLLSGLTVLLALSTTDMSNIIFTRFNMYFFITYIILLPSIVIRFKEKNVIATIIYVLIISYYIYIASTSRNLTPYNMNFNLFN